MKKTAIIFASHDGHTKTICETINQQLQMPADLLSIENCNAQTLENYDIVVFGSSVRYGKHLKPMVNYMTKHKALLADKKTAFFSVNLTARKPNRNTPETSPYLQKLLAKIDWQPNEIDVFAGKINYPIYGFFDKKTIQLIMWLTKGPTDLDTVKIFTDWARVRDFSERLNKLSNMKK